MYLVLKRERAFISFIKYPPTVYFVLVFLFIIFISIKRRGSVDLSCTEPRKVDLGRLHRILSLITHKIQVYYITVTTMMEIHVIGMRVISSQLWDILSRQKHHQPFIFYKDYWPFLIGYWGNWNLLHFYAPFYLLYA